LINNRRCFQPIYRGETPEEVAARIAKIAGVVDVGNGINPAGDAPDVPVDAAKAALEGMDPDSITKSLDAVLRGTVVTRIARGIKMVGVRLWMPKGTRNTDTDLRNLRIRAPDGHLFPLQRVATLRAISGQRSAVSRRLPAKT
jgi:Cu/Ag efflux pump CusA